ncbi:neurofilament heavy polypeptide-like [Impatiens glandulifera]|uniref:neurofilament heavy polypeptide-like n=1 Tax=Impatiens glandulifera TaxID=253017 RepID=UPI001FB1618C|nr:neurofilament heavy polypeptide-like [Impatiens glandulifera]
MYNARVFRGTPHFDTHIQSKVGGIVFDFTENDFARCFNLPKQGLTDLNVSADVKAGISLAFARSNEPVDDHGSKSLLRAEYQLLNDVIGRSILGRDVTNTYCTAAFNMMEAITTGTPVNWSRVLFDVLIWMIGVRTVDLVPQLSCLLVELGVPTCPGEEEEESASTSERTGSEKTDDEEQSGQSPDNAGTGANPETAEGGEEHSEEEEEEDDATKADRIARRLLEVIARRADNVGEIYREWHEHRFNKLYRDILLDFTDEECFQRLKEVEEIVMVLTNSETIHEALGRTSVIRPRARLQKLTVRIRKIKERYEDTSEDTLTPLVLQRLEKAREELVEEIKRLEEMYKQREISHYTAPRIDKSPTHRPTPPRADPATNKTDERTDPPLTGQPPHDQPEVSEPGVTKEWVKSLLQEFEDSTVNPLEEKMQRPVSSALRFANKTRQLLLWEDNQMSEIEDGYREEAESRSKQLQRTVILEDKTSEIEKNFDRLERETDQRLTEVTEDLIGTTLGRVSELEKKNEGLEAELKALTAQVAELLNAKINADVAVMEANARAAQEVQDALDNKARKAKDPPQLTEEERAERERRTAAKYPGLAKSVAAQAAKDAERLDRERQRLEGFAAANKKKKEVHSSSVPAKRKRESSKKAQVADLLNEVTDTVIESIPDQATHVEEEDEEHLLRRPTRQRVSGSESRPQPVKKKRNKDLMVSYDFSDSE